MTARFARGRLLAFARFAGARFVADRCSQSAAALAYTTLFALVPLIAAVLGILSAFTVFSQWQDDIVRYAFANFVPATGDAIRNYFAQFTANASKATAVGVIVLLFSAISLMMSIEDAFNRIWRVPAARALTSRLLLYWAVLTAGPILLVGALASTSYVLALPLLARAGESIALRAALIGKLPFLIEWFALAAMYALIPNCRVRPQHAAIGALLAALAVEAAKQGFTTYVGASYHQVYGALAIVPIFIVWIYLSWTIVLAGASLSASLAAFDYRPDAPRLAEGEEFRGLVRTLGHFLAAQRDGKGLSADDLRAREPFLDDALARRYLHDLIAAKLIGRGENGKFAMIRDPAAATLYDLYAATNYRLPLLGSPLPGADLATLDEAATQLHALWREPLGRTFASAPRD